MAKGNMLLGYSRGSVGDVTFTKIKGQQVARARNRNPHNPRTNKQSLQRAIFAAAVKFYTRGNQNFYKFAFENKKAVESDYNAFMRENVKRAPAISREAFANYNYPVFAPFIMAKGSLPTINSSISGNNFLFDMEVAQPETIQNDSVAQLSQVLIGTGKYQLGDILTAVFIASNYDETYPAAGATGKNAPKWTVKQIIIDTNSTASLGDDLGMQMSGQDDKLYLIADKTGGDLSSTYNAVCLVHSRVTNEGTKVSTQELVLDTAATTAYEAAQADAYKQAVIASWQAEGSVDAAPEAILQGSIAYEG